jgi:hypothetical protein
VLWCERKRLGEKKNTHKTKAHFFFFLGQALDSRIALAQHELQLLGEDSLMSALAFVSYSDVVSLPMFKDQAILAIKTPPNTRLEVPDPDEVRREFKNGRRVLMEDLEGNDGGPQTISDLPEKQ